MDDEGLVKYYRECVCVAERRVVLAKYAIDEWENRLRRFEKNLENTKLRLVEAQNPNEEAAT